MEENNIYRKYTELYYWWFNPVNKRCWFDSTDSDDDSDDESTEDDSDDESE